MHTVNASCCFLVMFCLGGFLEQDSPPIGTFTHLLMFPDNKPCKNRLFQLLLVSFSPSVCCFGLSQLHASLSDYIKTSNSLHLEDWIKWNGLDFNLLYSMVSMQTQSDKTDTLRNLQPPPHSVFFSVNDIILGPWLWCYKKILL